MNFEFFESEQVFKLYNFRFLEKSVLLSHHRVIEFTKNYKKLQKIAKENKTLQKATET